MIGCVMGKEDGEALLFPRLVQKGAASVQQREACLWYVYLGQLEGFYDIQSFLEFLFFLYITLDR